MVQQKQDMQTIKSKLEEISKIQVDISYAISKTAESLKRFFTPDQLINGGYTKKVSPPS